MSTPNKKAAGIALGVVALVLWLWSLWQIVYYAFIGLVVVKALEAGLISN